VIANSGHKQNLSRVGQNVSTARRLHGPDRARTHAQAGVPVESKPDVPGYTVSQRGLHGLGSDAQSVIYEKSSIDLALKDAFRKMRAFLMKTKGLTEDEAISLISIAVDFGVTQVVDGNWGIHAIVKKSLFAGASV
jgi:acetamidase/formamidase